MTGNIAKVTDHIRGESLELTFEITDVPGDTAIDAADFTWRLVPRGDTDEVLLSSEDSDVDVSLTDGNVVVNINQDLTSDIGLDIVREQLTFDPPGTTQRKWGADFRINEQ